MRLIEYSGQFKRDLKRVKKRGKDMQKIKLPMQLLIDNEQPPSKYSDHAFVGQWRGCRDLHLEPDWLLIYRFDEEVLRFERIGSHSDLFD